jgi:hypothetical protein
MALPQSGRLRKFRHYKERRGAEIFCREKAKRPAKMKRETRENWPQKGAKSVTERRCSFCAFGAFGGYCICFPLRVRGPIFWCRLFDTGALKG